jgi:hypothetical protein
MKTVQIEASTLDGCIAEAQKDRVIVMRDGAPVALIVGVDNLDQEQVELSGSDEFWQLIAERCKQRGLSRAEVEQRLADNTTEPTRA